MHGKRLVIFDLDGTLIDSFTELFSAVNHIRTIFGLPHFSEHTVRKILGNGSNHLVEKALLDASPAELERARKEYYSYSKLHLLTSTTAYPGLKETLAALKRKKVIMAVISNKHSGLSRKILSHLGIIAYFTVIIGHDSLPFRKPSPEPILKLLDNFRLDARDCIIVGDSASDILSGKMAGVVTVGCTYGYGNASGLKHADYRISSMPELLTLPFMKVFSYHSIKKPRDIICSIEGLKT